MKKLNPIEKYSIRLSDHIEIRRRERSIVPEDIERIVWQWDVIEDYQEDNCVLLWGKIESKILHAVCTYPNDETMEIIVITAYIPNDTKFTSESNYRERINK